MSERTEPKVLQDSKDCEHLWLDYEPGPCPTCAEIKAAEDKRGAEVLKIIIESFEESHKEGVARSITIENMRQAYEDLHDQG